MTRFRNALRVWVAIFFGLIFSGCVSKLPIDRMQMHDGEWIDLSHGRVVVDFQSGKSARMVAENLSADGMTVCPRGMSENVKYLDKCPSAENMNAQVACTTTYLGFHLFGIGKQHGPNKESPVCIVVSIYVDKDDVRKDKILVDVIKPGDTLVVFRPMPPTGVGGTPRPQSIRDPVLPISR